MQRLRRIAGPPLRTASAAWEVLVQLITDTLTASSQISAEDVDSGLVPLRGLGAALIAGGHLETTPIVLVSNTLHVSLTVPTGAAAVGVDENLNPVPGESGASADWMLYLPTPPPLAKIISAATQQSTHLSAEPAPAEGA